MTITLIILAIALKVIQQGKLFREEQAIKEIDEAIKLIKEKYNVEIGVQPIYLEPKISIKAN